MPLETALSFLQFFLGFYVTDIGMVLWPLFPPSSFSPLLPVLLETIVTILEMHSGKICSYIIEKGFLISASMYNLFLCFALFVQEEVRVSYVAIQSQDTKYERKLLVKLFFFFFLNLILF